MKLEIHLGTFKPHHSNLNQKVLENAEKVNTIKDFPPPRVGDIIYGRSDDGIQYIGEVVWVHHFYELGVIRVYAGRT